MPDISWNKLTWDGPWNWETGGEEWSTAWGGSEAQWFGSIFPRIHRFLPAGRILEIAPGFGRWTRFLLATAKVDYVGIDLSEECVRHCREIFKDVGNARFEKNDGLSLEIIPDRTIDFVFTFDSLVHAEVDVLESYIPQLLKKLTAKGIAFVHHSNWPQSSKPDENPHSRGETVNASVVEELVSAHNGAVHLQEMINWGGESLIDCFSIFSRKSGYPDVNACTLQNSRFMEEASIVREVFGRYARLPFLGI